jgi:hypothetical protein
VLHDYPGGEVKMTQDIPINISKYNPDAFVPRPAILDELQDWVDRGAGDKQVLSLIAPPGTGKTWLLNYLKSEWGKQRFIIWVNIPTLVSKKDTLIREEMLDTEAISVWLKKVIEEAKKYCKHFPDYDPALTFGRMIELIVEIACQRCDLPHHPLVLVDGYDNVGEEQALVVSDRLLAPFVGDDCWRMIIARREERRLINFKLRNSEETDKVLLEKIKELFSVADDDFVFEQFHKFIIAYRKNVKVEKYTFENWMTTFTQYTWNHPFINAYLFDQATYDGSITLNVPTQKQLTDCLLATIQRRSPDAPKSVEIIPDSAFDILRNIACELNETWTELDFEELFGLKSRKELERLFENGIIVPAGDDFRSRYKIANGLREFLCEICARP